MSKSETMLTAAIENARANAVYPVTSELCKAILIGRDRLDRVEISSDRCGREWTLNKLRQSAMAIDKALAANNGGVA